MPRNHILNSAINVVRSAAEKHGLKVTDDEITSEAGRLIIENNLLPINLKKKEVEKNKMADVTESPLHRRLCSKVFGHWQALQEHVSSVHRSSSKKKNNNNKPVVGWIEKIKIK